MRLSLQLRDVKFNEMIYVYCFHFEFLNILIYILKNPNIFIILKR